MNINAFKKKSFILKREGEHKEIGEELTYSKEPLRDALESEKLATQNQTGYEIKILTANQMFSRFTTTLVQSQT